MKELSKITHHLLITILNQFTDPITYFMIDVTTFAAAFLVMGILFNSLIHGFALAAVGTIIENRLVWSWVKKKIEENNDEITSKIPPGGDIARGVK